MLWHSLATYFRLQHGKRVQKIPLDAGASCPNRDGSLGHGGCIFCDAQGSGSGLLQSGFSLQEQWDMWKNKYTSTDDNRHFMAYFQSFSNTYGTAKQVERLVSCVQALSGNVGLSVGTRPDCVDAEKLDILASCTLPHVWIEYGLQSCHDATLHTIQRRHSVQDSERAIHLAAERGLKVCGHLMAGLPGESTQDFLASVRWAISLPLAGLKIHSLFVCRDSPLEHWYRHGRYTPLEQDDYIDMLARALPLIPSHIVMHRLTGDPAPGQCLAPLWTLEKRPVLTALIHRLQGQNAWQGSAADVPEGRPEWYGGS